MELGLRGTRALITGGSHGIGFAVAETLAAEGAAVGLVARDLGGLADAAERLGKHGVPVATAPADVADPAMLDRAVGEIAHALGGLNNLVANAGGTVGGNLTESSSDDLAATFALNAGHAAQLIRAGLPHLRSKGGGAVVIVSSITGMRPAPRTNYAVAKAAEIHLAAVAAQELASHNIRVNAVSPGSIMFPGGSWETFQRENPADFAAFLETQFPLGRLGRPEEVADVVAFLLSAAGILGHRSQHRGGRSPVLPERPPLRQGLTQAPASSRIPPTQPRTARTQNPRAPAPDPWHLTRPFGTSPTMMRALAAHIASKSRLMAGGVIRQKPGRAT